MTAFFEVLYRDILAEIPVIFRKEIYACICGRNCIFMLKKFNLDNDILYLITSMVILVRLMAVKFKWYYPL
jgi:uncharacterized membrane protein YeiH